MEMSKASEEETINRLIQLCRQSERRILNTAEHIRNRGLKMVVKAYAQQRVQCGDELHALLSTSHFAANTDEHTSGGLKRGWLDIKAALIVPRQSRQRMLLRDLPAEDKQVISYYATALAQQPPLALNELLTRQYAQLLLVHEQLSAMARQGGQRLRVRLFDQVENAQTAVKTLLNAGVPRSDISLTTVKNLEIYQEHNQHPGWAGRETVLVSGLFGLLIGAFFGGAYAVMQQTFYPDIVGFIIPTKLGAAFDVIGGGAFIVALFALIFGAIISRDAAEDDNYLYATGQENGDTLVAVTANSTNLALVEKSIGLRHEFEVRPVTS